MQGGERDRDRGRDWRERKRDRRDRERQREKKIDEETDIRCEIFRQKNDWQDERFRRRYMSFFQPHNRSRDL